MSYKTKKILRDAQGNPIPQLFNPDIDDFEPLYGQNGSQRVLLWGPNDEPLLTDTNPGKVEVTNTVNTQLTGSYVKRHYLISTNLTAGSIVATPIFDVTGKRLAAGIRLNQATNFELRYEPFERFNDVDLSLDASPQRVLAQRSDARGSGYAEIVSPRARVVVVNNGENDVQIVGLVVLEFMI